MARAVRAAPFVFLARDLRNAGVVQCIFAALRCLIAICSWLGATIR